MAVSPTYPGVYVQEVPSGVRTIVGVGTSTALFIGRTLSGPMLKAVRINTYTDFVRTFGDDGGAVSSMARYLRLFFLNGGTDCYVVRIASGWAQSSVELENEAGASVLKLTAKNPGQLGDLIRAAVTYNTTAPEATFNLEVFRWEISVSGARSKVDREEFLNLSMDPASPNYAPTALTQRSKLVDGAAVGVTAGAAGSSTSMAPLEAGTHTALATSWNARPVTARQFRIAIGNKKPVTVTVRNTLPAAPASWAAARTDLATAIRDDIQAALTAEGVTGLPNPAVVVAAIAGPTAVAAAPAETTLIQITATTDASNPSNDVRITASASGDLATTLGLGAPNGGLEIGAFAARRPRPTGVSFTPSTANLVAVGSLLKTELGNVQLDEVTSAGTVARIVPFTPLGTATRVWQVSPTDGLGVAAAWKAIADQVNAFAAANPTTFFWSAAVWGNRLVFTNTASDDNAGVGPAGTGLGWNVGLAAALVAIGTAMTGRFATNVRYLSLGSSGNTVLGSQANGVNGNDGGAPTATDYTAAYNVVRSDVDLWNLLVLPPDTDTAAAVPLEQLWPEASAFCHEERAFLIMDPPTAWTDTQTASSGVNALRTGLTKDHSAVYFPRLKIVEGGREHVVGPAGAMAGLYARIDANRGVWKAPAGSEADLRGVTGVNLLMSDLQNGAVNPVGVNAIRSFPEGVISWGARTMDGADAFASEYKYVPIRRLALFIEESLYRGLKWVVFEPNDEPLWAQVRLNVGAFMHDLFRKGAFAGVKPSDAYFVKCDKETTTFNDQNLGIVNIWVGFAPLKPAEFVVLYLQQIAQKLAT
ncbi:MAG: phage tail sheath family protein [Myxococcales bacterium]|nr:phage tail sheath family protein [Myxococcales bacterium]